MELEELKDIWKGINKTGPVNYDIDKMLRESSSSPLVLLRKRLRRHIVTILLAIGLVIFNLSPHHRIFEDGLFWCYIFFCIIIIGFLVYGFLLVSNIEKGSGSVKSNIQARILLLENSLRLKLLAIRIMPLIFILLMEVLMYYHQEPSLEKWFANPWYGRLAAYAGGILFFYFFSRFSQNRKYSGHLTYLKQLIQQMD